MPRLRQNAGADRRHHADTHVFPLFRRDCGETDSRRGRVLSRPHDDFSQRVAGWQRNGNAVHTAQPARSSISMSTTSCFRLQLRQSFVTSGHCRSPVAAQGTAFAELRGAAGTGSNHTRAERMQVERITTWPELAAIEADWNALAGGMPFRSWDWLATWWKHYGDSRRDGRSRLERLHERRAVRAGRVRRCAGRAPAAPHANSSASRRGTSTTPPSKATWCDGWEMARFAPITYR